MIRLLLVGIFLLLFFLLSIPLFLIEWIIGKCSSQARDISSLRIVQWALRVILFISGIDYQVIGRENLPTDRSAMYIANHSSIFDIVLTYPLFSSRTGFVSKAEVRKIPILSHWMKLLYCLFVDRTDMRSGIRVISDSTKHLQDGISVFYFPEGTRNKTSTTMAPFKAGAFKAALKANAPIVMISINHSREIFEQQMPLIRKTHVVVEISKPLEPSTIEGGYKELSAHCQEALQEMIDRNQH